MEYYKSGYCITVINGNVVSKKKMPHKRFFKKNTKKETEWLILQKECLNLKYSEFLTTKYWKKVCQMVLKRDKNRCTVCGSTEKLNVHHTTYKHHFNEHLHMKDLITLCEFHHYDWHCKFEINT